MHLKKIVISGFKSFADRVVLDLEPGITGIVGPNGSGKSNVIDAVRWVMGEQNAKHLRGEKATDIIFAGSQARKAQAMAEVSLIFDNADASPLSPIEFRQDAEIILSRRLYLDGSREYLINRKACRLKDIVEFFATTGLGGRSYSMIQQGQVDRILSAKPEDIREILEEAAGTIIFRKKKHDAERKLQYTQHNLARIDDLLIELDRQLEALGSQVEKAQEYQDIIKQLKQRELTAFVRNYLFFRQQKDLYQKKKHTLQHTEIELLSAMTKAETQLATLNAQLEEQNPELTQIQERISQLREQMARAETAILHADERMESAQERLTTLDEVVLGEQAKLEALHQEVVVHHDSFEAAKRTLYEDKDRLETFDEQAEVTLETAQVLQSRLEDMKDATQNIQRLLDHNTMRRESVQQEMARLKDQKSQLLNDTGEQKVELDSLERDLHVEEQRVEDQRGQVDAEVAARLQLEERLTSQRHKRDESKRVFEQVTQNQGRIRAQMDSFAGFERGVSDLSMSLKALEEAAPHARSLHHGLLGEHLRLIPAKQDRLTQAAKESFEWFCERLVFTDSTSLQRFLELWHEHLGEDARPALAVMLLTESTGQLTSGERLQPEASSGALSIADLIEVRAEAGEALRQHLSFWLGAGWYLPDASALGGGWFESAEAGEGLGRFWQLGFNGMLRVDICSAYVGRCQGEGLLARQQELERLQLEAREVEASLSVVGQELKLAEAETQSLSSDLEALDERLKTQNHGVLEALSKLQAAKQAHAYKAQLYSDAQSKLEGIEERLEVFEGEVAELEQSRHSLEGELEQLKVDASDLSMEYEEQNERRTELISQKQGIELDLAKAEERAKSLELILNKSRSELVERETRLEHQQAEQKAQRQKLDQSKAEKEQQTDRFEELLAEREQREVELYEKRASSAETLEAIKASELSLKDYRKQQSALQKETNECGLQLERAEMAIQSVKQQAQEQYQVDLKDFAASLDPAATRDASSSEGEAHGEEQQTPERKADTEEEQRQLEQEHKAIQKLRQRVEQFGPVNMMAIEEHKSLSERHTFIQAQRDEIQACITLLQHAITEIEETSVERFMLSYELINKEFGEIFPILFPGGQARLELTVPEDLLTTGVEIMVQLPGKKQQRMNLFSGGEKALTAISLIFALLKNKPTPFCFLDEVDAPLDEANVGRFNHILEVLSSRFQFIIITHNRRTMEVLDTLYGVTMQEPGVSKVVGVDMQKDIPDHLKKAFKAQPAEAQASTALPS